jgi:hypothetical protein
MEVYKSIPNYEEKYIVSNYGNVKSLLRGREKLLKPSLINTGYLLVNLYSNGIAKSKLIHQLVAEAFLNHKSDGHKIVVDHIDDNKLNNNVENLQLVTQRYNVCKTQSRYKSKYKGVHRNGLKWRAAIRIDKKLFYLGTFNCELKAHLAYTSKLKTI